MKTIGIKEKREWLRGLHEARAAYGNHPGKTKSGKDINEFVDAMTPQEVESEFNSYHMDR